MGIREERNSTNLKCISKIKTINECGYWYIELSRIK